MVKSVRLSVVEQLRVSEMSDGSAGGEREKRTVEQLLDEVDVGEDHATAAIPFQSESVEGLAV